MKRWILILFLIFVACNKNTKERNIIREQNKNETGSNQPVYIDNAERFALVIGNSKYKNVDKLSNPKNDADDMAKALKKLNFKVYEYTNISYQKMKQAIADFSNKLTSNSVALFYYAGHGIQYNGINYLVPTDAKLNSEADIEYECVNVNQVLDNMAEAKTRTNIILLDACRNNPFARSWERGTGQTGLAFMNAPDGTIIAYATAPGKVAADKGTNGRNGLFTEQLLKYINTPNLSFVNIFDLASKEVNKIDKTQRPWISKSVYDPFYIAGYIPEEKINNKLNYPSNKPNDQPSEENVHNFTDFTVSVAGVDIEMVAVKGGTFQMGSNDGYEDEKPKHEVTVNDFYIGKYEVTQAQYRAIMGENPSYFKNCDNCPVEEVSWYDAIKFCNVLSKKAGLEPYYIIDKNTKDPNNENSNDDLKWTITINEKSKGFRLPTEAEWEYAARGGQKSRGYKYAGSDDIDEVAWYTDNSKNKTHPVGQKKPNELEIYDMSGNVWEWCWDWYKKNYYKKSPKENPVGPAEGSDRVFRGGCWDYDAFSAHVARRHGGTPDYGWRSFGFRLVRSF